MFGVCLLQLPKFNFWRENWVLGYVSIYTWEFYDIPLIYYDCKSYVVRQLVRKLLYQVYYTRYQASFYL